MKSNFNREQLKNSFKKNVEDVNLDEIDGFFLTTHKGDLFDHSSYGNGAAKIGAAISIVSSMTAVERLTFFHHVGAYQIVKEEIEK